MTVSLAAICAAIWGYLVAARAYFWGCSVHDNEPIAWDGPWPSVVAIVPARNEADCIAASVRSVLGQDYGGRLDVVVVDDDSADGTADIARRAAAEAGCDLSVVPSGGPAAGWSGKLWALRQGLAAAQRTQPDFLLLTDADIVHATPDAVRRLVSRAMAGGFVLTSLMAKLRCESLAERVHVPAFIYFFQMLYPFSWVCRPDRDVAAAAGGCMLIRAAALARAGGFAAIHNAQIDDCALAARLKAVGPIWLGLTNRVRSIRAYPTFADIRQMIARSAYAQLHYSPLLLVGTIAGMALAFLAPPLLAIFASGWAQYLGIAAWLMMSLSFIPTLRFYKLQPLWAVALPAIAALYSSYTLASAYQHFRRRGGQWKGRVHVNAPSLQ